MGDEGFRLAAPAKLLAEWEENYDYRRNTVREFYTLRPISDFERLLAEACAKDKSACFTARWTKCRCRSRPWCRSW